MKINELRRRRENLNVIYVLIFIAITVYIAIAFANYQKDNENVCHLINKEIDGEYFECIECKRIYSLTCNFQKPRG